MATTTSISTNILGPLTTTFTQQSSCTQLASVGIKVAYRDQFCYSDEAGGNMDCWPTPTLGADTAAQALSTWGVYSPGLVCPSGYTTGCMYDGSASSGNYQDFYYPPGPSETAIGCCPSGYICADQQHCTLRITSSTVATYTCSASSTIGPMDQSIPYIVTVSSTVQTIATFSAIAPLLQMLYQASDVSAASSGSNATETSSAQSQDDGGQLSVGASVGIGVGVGAFAIGVAVAAVLIWARRRKRTTASATDRGSGAAFLGDEQRKVATPSSPVELHAYQQPAEAGWGGAPQELDGGNMGTRHERNDMQ